MKKLLFAGILLGVSIVIGCSSESRVDIGVRPAAPSASNASDPAKASAKLGMDNASITQQVMKTGRLPNGQPLPNRGGPPAPPPPGSGGG